MIAQSPMLLLEQSRLIRQVEIARTDEKRMHIHVEKKKGRYRKAAKFWLEPKIELAFGGNLSKKEIMGVMKMIEMYKDTLVKK